MHLIEWIERTLDYRWEAGAHRRMYAAHVYPRDGTWLNQSHLTLVCPHDGAYSAELQLEKRTVTVQKNEVVLVPAFVPFTVRQPRRGRQSYAHIQFAMLGGLDPFSAVDLPLSFRKKEAAEIREALLALASCHAAPAENLGQVGRRKASAFRLFSILYSQGRGKAGARDLLNRFPRIQPAVSHIIENPSLDISRDQLASLCHLSPSRFNHVFRTVMGVPPKKFLQEERQKLALRLIRNAGLSIAAIAERTGYCDQFEFSRRFKKRWGSSPRSYRLNLGRFADTLRSA